VVTEAPTWDHELLLKLGVAAFAAMNMMSLSAGVYLGWWSGMDERFAELFRWLQLVLATPVALWCALPFYRGAWNGLKTWILPMDLPVSLGILVLYGHGLFATLTHEDAYLDSLGMLVGLLLAGRLLEQRGRSRAAEAASLLSGEIPHKVRREREGRLEEVDPLELEPGDCIRAVAGEELGADGIAEEGEAQLKMAILTGEAAPVLVKAGSRVVAGALVLEGSIRVRVEAVGAKSLVGQMAQLLLKLGDREEEKTETDTLAPYFTGITLLIAVITALAWLPSGEEASLKATVAVLVVACPCALALSSPLAAAAGLAAAARRGVLLRGGSVLRRLATVKEVALDKTGTLTTGEFGVCTDNSTLLIAASLERHSLHPVARAIVAAASERQLPLKEARSVKELVGVGIEGEVDGIRYQLEQGQKPGEVLLKSAGHCSLIRLEDRVRPEAAKTIAALQKLGLRVTILSGDHPDIAAQLQQETSADAALGGMSPTDKASWLEKHPETLFVGDGLNDGPGLRAAALGLAMQGGAAPSLLVADGIAVDISGLPAAIRAARIAKQTVKRGIYRSLAYNLLAVTAAALGLINPLVAALLMPLSSGMVIGAAARLESYVAKENP
jgi:Cu2+-exporting ATPase